MINSRMQKVMTDQGNLAQYPSVTELLYSIEPFRLTTYYLYATDRSLQLKLDPYFITAVPCVLLSIITIILNIFVINFYRKNKLTLVPLLYTMISGADILTAVGIIHQSIAISLFTRDVISEVTLNHNTVVCYTLIQISYRSSVFYNLVLAFSRTVMILSPFHQIKIKIVIVACVLYVVPWMFLAGNDVHKFYILDHNFSSDMYTLYIGMGPSLPQTLRISYADRSSCYIILIALMVIAFLIPVVLIIVTCIVQVISLNRSRQVPASSNQRHVTITVILMSTLFVVCNSTYYGYLFSAMIQLTFGIELGFYHSTLILYVVVYGTLLPILGSVLNPVIIIFRSSGLRRKFWGTAARLCSRSQISNESTNATDQTGISITDVN